MEFERKARHWWRFDSYEVQDGYVRPTAAAKGDVYDPREDPGALDSLLDLVNVAPFTREGGARIAAWCRDHGLLGILPHRAVHVTLAARWVVDRPGETAKGAVHAEQIEMVRCRGEWGEHHEYEVGSNGIPKWGLDREPGLVEAGELPAGFSQPAVRLRSLFHSFTFEKEPLVGTWGQFFPSIPPREREAYRYPSPSFSNEGFWRIYAEPVETFLRTIAALRDALALVGGDRDALESHHRTLQQLPGGAGQRWSKQALREIGLDQLNALLEPCVHEMILGKRGTFARVVRAPSLLAYLALGEMERIVDKKSPPRRCPACGKIFTSNDRRAVYCTPRCRATAKMRRYRNPNPRSDAKRGSARRKKR